jgi:hypothetical protein
MTKMAAITSLHEARWKRAKLRAKTRLRLHDPLDQLAVAMRECVAVQNRIFQRHWAARREEMMRQLASCARTSRKPTNG